MQQFIRKKEGLAVLICVISNLLSLLGNVVVGYLIPWFDGKQWLAIVLFTLAFIILLPITFFEKKETKASSKSKLRRVKGGDDAPSFFDRIRAWLQQLNRGIPLRIAIVLMIFVVPSAFLAGWFAPGVKSLWAQHAPVCPPYTACVIVAQFTPVENQLAQEINKFVEEELKNVVAEVKAQSNQNITVQIVPPVANVAEAKQLVHDRRAVLVVWGGVLELTNMTQVHFQLSDRLGIGENDDVRPFRLQPVRYDELQEQVKCKGEQCKNLMDEIAIRARMIAHTAAGLFQYANGQPERARTNFLAALHCAGKLRDVKALSGSKLLCKTTAKPDDISLDLLYYYTGRALALQGDYKNAIPLLQRAALHNETDPAAWIGLVSAWQGWLHNKSAAPYMNALQTAQQRVDPNMIPLSSMNDENQVAIFSAAGVLAELEENSAKAVEQYKEAVRLSEQDNLNPYVPLVNLGRAQRLNGDNDGAKTTLQQAIQYEKEHSQPISPWALIELARTHTQRTEAQDELNRAIAAAPNDSYPYIARGELCDAWSKASTNKVDKNDVDCAMDAYAMALQKRPESGWLLGHIGDFYRLLTPTNPGYITKAKEYYRRAALQRPCDPWAHARYAYALAMDTLSDPKAAILQYQLAVQLVHPDTAPGELDNLKRNLQTLQTTQGAPEPSPKALPQCQALLLNE